MFVQLDSVLRVSTGMTHLPLPVSVIPLHVQPVISHFLSQREIRCERQLSVGLTLLITFNPACNESNLLDAAEIQHNYQPLEH